MSRDYYRSRNSRPCDSVFDYCGLNRFLDRHLIAGKKAAPKSCCCAVLWETNATRGTMAPLFSLYAVCARSSPPVFRQSLFVTKTGAVGRVNPCFSHKPTTLLQQHRRCFGRSNAVFRRPWSRTGTGLWVCGVAVGVAVAVGLKCRSDSARDLCDVKSDRYSDAIKVSRDLVERIKVRISGARWAWL